ncbi:MAG: hypothetical protein RLZZ200_2812 [Pseudomonadota bacterium]|jgi:DNA-binding response OmpR family regulator
MHIGILEDDLAQQELYQLWLETAQHSCECHGTRAEFAKAATGGRFDAFILDWNLPDGSGETTLRWIRDTIGWNIPVIFVTSRDAEKDIVSALRSGADDYLIKPPKAMELLARLEALGRRIKAPAIERLGAYEINNDTRQLLVNGKEVELTQKEFELACYMFHNRGKLLSRVHLLEKIWGISADVDTRTIDTHVSRIRRKLAISPDNGWQIIPVYGYGYRIERLSDGPKA